MLDVTSSMSPVISAVQDYLIQYIIRRCLTSPIVRLGLVLVDDHYGTGTLGGFYIKRVRDAGLGRVIRYSDAPVIPFAGVTDNLEEYANWLEQIELRHGGDTAECFACGVAAARTMMPSAVIWVLTDAYPHGPVGQTYITQCPIGNPFPAGVNVVKFHLGMADEERAWIPGEWGAPGENRIIQVDMMEFTKGLMAQPEALPVR